jgi:hypothetical protein
LNVEICLIFSGKIVIPVSSKTFLAAHSSHSSPNSRIANGIVNSLVSLSVVVVPVHIAIVVVQVKVPSVITIVL